MAEDGSVLIKILADASEFEKSLSGIAGKGASLIGKGFAAAEGAIVAAGAASTRVGMDFESSMSQVAATMGMTTEEIQGGSKDFETLKNAAQQAGETTAFSATESAQALNYLALAGYDAGKAVEVLPSVLNLAAAGGMGLASASDMVTDSMSALGIEATKSNVDEFGDKMAKTASEANTSVAQLGEAILTVGGTAKDLAGGTTELNTCLGILADNGIKGAEGGTALRNMILSLEAPTDQAAGKLEDLGVKVFDSAGEMRSMQDIMADLNKAMANMTSGERTQALNTIFNKVDLKSVNALLGTSTERWNELSGAIDNSTGAMQAMADVQLDNLEGDITLLKSALEGCGIAVYDHLNEPLRDAVKTVTEVVGDITKAVKSGKFDDLFDGIGEAIESVIELILKAGEAVGKIAPVATKVLGVAADAVSLLLDNIEGVVAAMAGVASVMATIKIASFVTNIMSAVKAFEAAETVITGVNAALEVMGVTMTLSTGGIIAIVAAATAALGAFIIANRDSAEEVGVNSAATKELCDEYDELHDSIEENRKASEERVSAAEQETAVAEDYAEKLEKLSKKENKSAGEKKRMKYYVDKLNEVLPDLNAKYDEEKDKLSKSTEEIYKNIDARKEQIKLDKYWENYEAAVNEEVDLQADKEKLEERQQKAKNAVDAAQRKYDSEVVQHKYTDPLSHVPDAKAKLDQAKKALAEVDEELRENGKAFRANADEQEGWLKKAETLSDTISLDEALSDLQKLAKEGGVTISESVEAGIREGRYQIPETVKGLKNLIKFDDAVQAAGLSGTQIPKALAEKISNGEISVKDAMNAVEKLAEFDSSEAVKKAEAAGVTIPGVLRQKIASGEMSVQEAIEGLQRRTQFEDAEIVKNARASGLNIPKGLVDSIATGKVSVDEAIQRVKDSMDLSGMATDAGMEGDKAVDSLIKSFLRGEIPVAEASQKLASLVEKNADPNLKATVEPELEKYQQTIQSRGPTVKQTAATALSGSVEAGAQTNLTPTANTAVDSYVDPFYNSGDRVLDATGVMPLNASTGAQTDLNPQGVGGSDTYAAGVRSGGDKAYGAGVFLSNNTQSGANTDLSPTGAQAGGSFANGMQSAMKAVSDICAAIVGQALSKIRSSTKAFQAVGRLLMTQMGTGIRNRATFVTAAAEGVVKRAINYARTEAGRSNSIGRDFSSGIAAGIAANSKEVTDAATSVINRAIAAAKRAADVNSPSKRTRDEVGAPLAEGVAVGIEQGSGDASAAAVDAVEGAVRAANTTAAKSSIDMSGLVASIPEAKKAIAANMDQLSAQAKAAVQYEMDRRAASISAYNTFSIPAYDDGRVIALLRELVTETRDGKTIMVGQRVLGRTVRQWEQKMARVTGGA